MNRVYLSEISDTPLSRKNLAVEANRIVSRPIFSQWDFNELNPNNRLAGKGHCDCNGEGEFVLLPLSDPDVQSGGKRYMYCRKCGGWSHL